MSKVATKLGVAVAGCAIAAAASLTAVAPAQAAPTTVPAPAAPAILGPGGAPQWFGFDFKRSPDMLSGNRAWSVHDGHKVVVWKFIKLLRYKGYHHKGW